MPEFLVCLVLCFHLVHFIAISTFHYSDFKTKKLRECLECTGISIMRWLFVARFSSLVRHIQFWSHHTWIRTSLSCWHMFILFNLHFIHCLINCVMLMWNACWVSTIPFKKWTPHPRHVAIVYVVYQPQRVVITWVTPNYKWITLHRALSACLDCCCLCCTLVEN